MKKVVLFLLVEILSVIIVPCVYADTYTNDDPTSETSNYGVDTIYEAAGYKQPALEVYNIDLSWDDLHWVFVYEGDITNPNSSIWIAKEYYDSANLLPKDIIADIDNWKDKDKREITVINNSGFSVNVEATVEHRSNLNYVNSAHLKVARFSDNLIFEENASITNLSNNMNGKFVVKPTSTSFVNNTGTTTSVTGEVYLTFTKYNN